MYLETKIYRKYDVSYLVPSFYRFFTIISVTTVTEIITVNYACAAYELGY